MYVMWMKDLDKKILKYEILITIKIKILRLSKIKTIKLKKGSHRQDVNVEL